MTCPDDGSKIKVLIKENQDLKQRALPFTEQQLNKFLAHRKNSNVKSVTLSVCLSVFLSVCLLYHSLSVSLSLSLSLSLPLSLSLSLSLSLYLSLSLSLSVYFSLSLCFSLTLFPFLYISFFHLSIFSFLLSKYV